MANIIRTTDLADDTTISDRDVSVNVAMVSVDINQTDGTYAVVEPYGSDGSYNGRIVIYPQSPVPQITSTVSLKTFDRVGSLYYPLDARFDYLRRKIWIADTGNNRVLKINLNSNQAETNIDEDIIYPHALAVDFNTGNIFIKGYATYDLNRGVIFYYKKDGTLLTTFLFNRDDTQESSSSSSFNGSMSSSSISDVTIPTLPSNRSMAFDHVRSRLWWVDGIRIYMADIRNKQIKTYDIRTDDLTEALKINIEFSTGNAIVFAKDIHDDSFLMQMFRDNNIQLGIAYVGV